MSRRRRLLLVIGCMVCLIAVASMLPAADPRLDAPGVASDGDAGGGDRAGDWESVVDSPGSTGEDDAAAEPTDTADAGTTTTDDSARSGTETGFGIEIDGTVAPGNEVRIGTSDLGFFDEVAVEVDGERVGQLSGRDEVTVTVPYAEEMTIAVPAEGYARTVAIPTNATIETRDAAIPGRDLEIGVRVDSVPISDATVYHDGEAVGTTDSEGRATVALPETAGPTDLRVERDPVEAERTVEVAEPHVRFTSLLVFPGFYAPVEVSADGAGVPNATVAVEGGGSAMTDERGQAIVRLPVTDEATVTVTVGEETATATIGNLYLRLAVPAILLPGFLIGGVVTYLRLAARVDRRERRLSVLFLWIGDAVAALSDRLVDALETLAGAVRASGASLPALPRPSLSFGRPALPSPNLSALRAGLGGVQSIGSALASLGGTSSDRTAGSTLGGWLTRSDDSDGPPQAEGGPSLAPEPLGPRGPHAEIRAAWHAFCDRLDVRNRETLTPGQVARRALAAGFPAAHVRRLVTLFREIEYGDRDPSLERVAAARAAVEELIAYDPDEEDRNA